MISHIACIALSLIVLSQGWISAQVPARAPQGLELQSALQASFHAVRDACLYVRAESDGGDFTAVIISPNGLVLTAGHCVNPKDECIAKLPDGRSLKLEAMGYESRIDIGMMRIINPPTDLPYVPLGRSADLQEDDALFGVSYPGGYQHDRGLVLRLGKVCNPLTKSNYIRSTVLMEPGDSGGPLFNIRGELVGIHSRIDSDFDANEDVPVDTFYAYWTELKAKEKFSAWKQSFEHLGLTTVTTDAGLRVSGLKQDHLAMQAGLRLGDTVLTVGGKPPEDHQEVEKLIKRSLRRSPMVPIPIKIKRRAQELEISLRSVGLSRLVEERQLPADLFALKPWDAKLRALSQCSPAVITIQSQLNGKQQQILGTIVSPDGHILTKASSVGKDIEITGSDQEPLSAVIMARDDDNDLVMLRVANFKPKAHVQFREHVGPQVGLLVQSILPSNSEAIRGAIGTQVFHSRDDFIIGVNLEEKEDGLEITGISRRGGAFSAGLRKGDLITALDGLAMKKRDQLVTHLQQLQHPFTVKATALREQETLEVVVRPKRRSSETMSGHAADHIPGGFSQRRGSFPQVFAHDSLIKSNQCGAPLFDLQGRVLGLTIARVSRTHCYALPNSVVRNFIQSHL